MHLKQEQRSEPFEEGKCANCSKRVASALRLEDVSLWLPGSFWLKRLLFLENLTVLVIMGAEPEQCPESSRDSLSLQDQGALCVEVQLLTHILLSGGKISCSSPASTSPPVGDCERTARAKVLWQLAAWLVRPEFRGSEGFAIC